MDKSLSHRSTNTYLKPEYLIPITLALVLALKIGAPLMGKVLSQHQIESYHKKGFISLIDVMSEGEANSYAEKLKAAETQCPRNSTGVNRNNGHLCFKFLDDLAYHPVVLDAVEDLLGSSFSLWGSVLFIKEPNPSHFVIWHQDTTYMGITPIILSPLGLHSPTAPVIQVA
tara:strand:+ start:186 stop:698 length:513 start_codon:yes stop_codon:yes gene_type:complete